MEVDSVQECPSPQKFDGDSGHISAEDVQSDNSAIMVNREKSNGNFSTKKDSVAQPVIGLVVESLQMREELHRTDMEGQKPVKAAEDGGFKVPRFSSKNPPPPPQLESSSKFKVPPPPQKAVSRIQPRRVDTPTPAAPRKQEVTSPPRAIPDFSEPKEPEGERENAGPSSGGDEERRQDTDHVNTKGNDGSGNPGMVGSSTGSDGACILAVEEPGVEVGALSLQESAAEVATDFERPNENSGATDLATASHMLSQPGVQVGTSSQNKSAAGDRAVATGPPYVKPSWSAAPGHPFTLEILRDGISLRVEDVSEKGAYMFGRSDRCDFVLEHPTISRFHAVLQYNAKGKAFIFDLGSTHGTFINKRQVQGKTYTPLNVGDVVRFGLSTRLYHFQGPTEFMPQEGLSKAERHAVRMLELAQEKAEKEQSLLRASRNAASADGATWGMQEDAVEEDEEEDTEEITWQNFKGELTEKQQKTLEKVHKRQEKLANLKKENDAIQAKEISQGGLTQGQQTQIARNEQRMAQLVEELENMEETLNESIREAIIGRSGIRSGGKKSLQNEDEDEDLSDDEFYDRTSKLKEKKKKKENSQVVETAETLLEKKSTLSKEIESVRLLMKAEEKQDKQEEVVNKETESVDPLDSFMTTISTSIEQDRTARLQKELDILTKDLERVERLLKIADPMGDASKKWELKQIPGSLGTAADLAYKIDKRIFPRKDDAKELASSTDRKDDISNATVPQAGDKNDSGNTPDFRPLDPPIRLGAPVAEEVEEKAEERSGRESDSAAEFISYKDRKNDRDGNNSKGSPKAEVTALTLSGKREEEAITGADEDVATSVALLLKHKRGLAKEDAEKSGTALESSQQPLKKKKMYGPAKPSYMTNAEEEESWVPPAGQTGDGRTALNDKYGY
ncbi:hypothetical protein R1flu_000861 [Riccia fluitans]|uniref:FHA domain-containing protein n=1 Tax=Riccia fluitans TaxID=41844 RepID=A0ABD1Y203_9MARC